MAKFVTLAEIAEATGSKNLTPEIDINNIKIEHRNVNRPQFQLAGYYDFFDESRIQVLGKAEYGFLQGLSVAERAERLERLFSTGIPAVFICRGLEAGEDMLNIAIKHGVPVLGNSEITAAVMVRMVSWIREQLAPTQTMYGVLIDVYGEGILITGVSGVGKSETAMELIRRGHRLVADDLVEVSKVGDELLIGTAPALTRHFIELRGIGVVDVKSLYGIESVKDRTPIDMIINLEDWKQDSSYDRLGLREEYEEILGVKVVKHTVPIRTGRNLAIIIETAAVNNRQKKMGYNAAQELCDRVSAEIHRKNNDKNE